MSELVGAARGERAPEERLTHRNGYRARSWATRAGEIELAIPKLRRGSYFPSFLEPRRRSEQALVLGRAGGLRRRRLDQEGRSGRRVARAADLQERGLADLRRAWMSRSTRSATGRSRAATPTCGSTRRSRRSATAAASSGRRLVLAYARARVRLPRGDRPRRRRGRDRGVLAQLPARPGRARPDRGAARRLRRARRAEEGDRPGARLPLAALHASTSSAKRSGTPAASSSRCSPR